MFLSFYLSLPSEKKSSILPINVFQKFIPAVMSLLAAFKTHFVNWHDEVNVNDSDKKVGVMREGDKQMKSKIYRDTIGFPWKMWIYLDI